MTVDEVSMLIEQALFARDDVISVSDIASGELGVETSAGRIYITIEDV